ncbi:CgeB family protein [Salinithrix halophila]|uniref:Glycosyltransferase n=1 Tax=Salinithrix halophila TaxID=1485204 RepID=A0ABV8JGC2_9BACL
MRLLFLTKGVGSLAHLNPNVIEAFRRMQNEKKSFCFISFDLEREGPKSLFRKIRLFQPDVALVMRGFAVPRDLVSKICSLGVPVGVWLADDPYHLSDSLRIARPYQFVLTQESSCVPVYRKRKIPAYFLPLAVNPKTYLPLQVKEHYSKDVCFVGNAFPERLHIIDQLAPFLLQKKFILIGKWWQRLKQYSRLKPHIIDGNIPPSEVVQYYNGSKIVLNIHRTCNDIKKNPLNLPAFTPNNRTFDIAACRSFQLISQRRDLGRFYRLGEEIICFNGAQDLKGKMDYYLANEAERKSIASRAYHRTLRQHTYDSRVRHLVKILEHFLLTNRRRGDKASRRQK